MKLLRGFAAPRLSAAGTLALACQLLPEQLCAVGLAGIGVDAEHATVARQRFPISPNARGLVRAQRLARHTGNPDGAGALFPGHDDPESSMTPKRMYGILKRISRSTGLALLPDRLVSRDDRQPAGPWLAPGELRVTSLESLGSSEAHA